MAITCKSSRGLFEAVAIAAASIMPATASFCSRSNSAEPDIDIDSTREEKGSL